MAGFCDVAVHSNREYIYIAFRHSAAEHRASTRIFHLTLFLASVLISAQVLLTPLASSSPVLRHVFFGLPLPCLPVTGNSYKVFKKTLHTPTTDWDILLKDSY